MKIQNIPDGFYPIFLRKYKDCCYISGGRKIYKMNVGSLIPEEILNEADGPIRYFNIVEDKIFVLVGLKLLKLYSFDKKLLCHLEKDLYLMNSEIRDLGIKSCLLTGYKDIHFVSNTFTVMPAHKYPKMYGKEMVLGGCNGRYGYFVDWDKREHLVIRDMIKANNEESISFPNRFSGKNKGIEEEDFESINLKVFSKDNNVFYFVTLEKGNLLIYKGVR